MEFGLGPPDARSSRPKRGVALKIVGALMMATGVLLVIGGVARLTSPPKDGTVPTPVPIVIVVGILGIACMVGGHSLWRLAGTPGESTKKWLAATPGLIAVVLMAAGLMAALAPSHEPPTDQYGYTQAQRQAFVAGCGGSTRCDCFFDAIERVVPPEMLAAAEQAYEQTGSLPPPLIDAIAQSGC